MELKTLFDQEMTAQGIIMPYIAPSFSHGDDDIDKTIEAAEWALTICRNALDNNRVKESLINGHFEKPVFRRK
jgi:glutamate-1-semialdehyde 2,1-aminomutase